MSGGLVIGKVGSKYTGRFLRSLGSDSRVRGLGYNSSAKFGAVKQSIIHTIR